MAKGGYRGGPMGGGVNMNMIRQAQKMQQEMLKMQAEMEEKTFSAQAPTLLVSLSGSISFMSR